MKARSTLFLWICLPFCAFSQFNPLVGSIPDKRAELLRAQSDTERIRLLTDLSSIQVQTRPDSTIYYAESALAMSHRISFARGEEFALIFLGLGWRYIANYPKAIACQLHAIQIAEKLNDLKGLAYSYSVLGAIYDDQGYYEQALANAERGLRYTEAYGEPFIYTIDLGILAKIFLELGQLDSARMYATAASRYNERYHFYFPHIPLTMGQIAEKEGDSAHAIACYRQSGVFGSYNHFLRDQLRSYTAIGRVYLRMEEADSAILYAMRALNDPVNVSTPIKLEAALILDASYGRLGRKDRSVRYLRLTSALKDTLFGQDQARQVQNLMFNETVRQLGLADEQSKEIASQQNFQLWLWYWAALGSLIITGLIVLYRYRISRLAQLQEVRNSISGDLHDDTGATLGSMNVPGGAAENKMAGGNVDQPASAFRKISALSYDMVDHMSDFVWAINPSNDNIESLVARTSNAFAEICAQRRVDLTFEVEDSLARQPLSMEKRKNIYLFVKEAITNAMRHAACDSIWIRFAQEDGAFRVSVIDNGKGFDAPGTESGNRLLTMRFRAEELHGTFTVTSEPGHTVVSCLLP